MGPAAVQPVCSCPVSDAWNFRGESVALTYPGIAMLVEGSAFCISEGSGDILHSRQGLFFIDTRLVSLFKVQVNGYQPEPLVVFQHEPYHATFLSRTRPVLNVPNSKILVVRNRYVGRGMREDLSIRNLADEPVVCRLAIALESDFARLFAVKEGRAEVIGDHSTEVLEGSILSTHRRRAVERGIRISFSQPVTEVRRPHPGAVEVEFEAKMGARGEWSVCIQFVPSISGNEVDPAHHCGEPVEHSVPAQRLEGWRKDVPAVTTNYRPLADMVARSLEDLASLRISDPDHPERVLVAAGAPWFMTLFGRDALLTAWMALTVTPAIALGVLQTLAKFQGTKVDPDTEEEPGRILHELRFEDAGSLSLADGNVYYGSSDATPLFVMLLGEMRRWGLAREVVEELLPNVDRALDWVDRFGDRDGDGYVEYQRSTDRGLENQGWKDSWDAIRFADGRLAEAPIAVIEVQGYVYSAFLARHYFAAETGDVERAEYWRGRAHELKAAFNRDFWLPDLGWYAMGLDKDKRPIDALASNMGHCLWTGIIDEDKASRVAELLLSPELFSGWGIRTLATSMAGYNPVSYHCGSVWPHENAIIAAGLMRYGFVDEAQRVVMALIDAAETQGGRLPELFSGLDRAEFPGVVSYPASCTPQAWAAAAPFSFLRTLLRFDPWVPHDKVWVHPALPEQILSLSLRGVPLAGGRVTIEASQSEPHVEGLPEGIQVVLDGRDPSTAV